MPDSDSNLGYYLRLILAHLGLQSEPEEVQSVDEMQAQIDALQLQVRALQRDLMELRDKLDNGQ